MLVVLSAAFLLQSDWKFALADTAIAPSLRVLADGKVPDDSRLGALKDNNGYFPFKPPKTKEGWDERSAQLRLQTQVALGLWPMPEKTPLNAVVYGKVDRDTYTVEKVYFESYPGHFVTGSLYRPKNKTGKLPGVLCPYGHWGRGPAGRFNEVDLKEVETQISRGAERFEAAGRHMIQAYPVQLARMGCVAFQYDMEGYSDCSQIPYELAHVHAKPRPEMNTPKDWGFFTPQADLRLQSIMGLQTYNSIRAIDFLCELPDVDPQRLAVTGASSGGTQVLMVGAVDPRLAVAVPAVMVGTAMQGGCVCENCELLRLGAGNVDFAALFAPKPLEAIGANDWTKEIETKGGPELQQLYVLLGAKDNVLVKALTQFPHNFNYVSRSEMYQWMNKQLKLDLKSPVIEDDFVPLTKEELTVWDDKHPKPTGGEDYERSLLRVMTEDADRQLAKLTPTDKKSLSAFRHSVGDAWDVLIGRSLPKATDTELQAVGETAKHEKYLEKRGLLRYKPEHEELPVVILQPRGETLRTAIWLDTAGKAGLYEADGTPRESVRKLVESGVQVVGIDLLYQGEFNADGKALEHARHVVNRQHDSAAYTYGYNRALFAQRVHDVLTAVAYFRGDEQPVGVVDLIGLNGAGHWAAAAKAIAGDVVRRTVVDTRGFRFANLTSSDDPNFLPGGAKYFDLPGLLALCAPGEIWVSDGAPAAADAQANRPAITVAAYQSAGAADKITWHDDPATVENAALAWLLQK
ncbi:MAG TPA: acetylxylan esterase [Pirellulales bacterium]|jgi:hypothetical protein